MKDQGYVVIGAGFGDEGKGLVTDYLCSMLNRPLVVRYSGGQQAGHTVVLDGKRHVFSNFGSGTLRGVPTYWAKSCTFDPVGMLREYDILVAMGVKPVLHIDSECPVTTPYDKMKNRDLSSLNGHGTCGVGIGTTVEREEKLYSLRVGDIKCEFVFLNKLESVRNYYSIGQSSPTFFDTTKAWSEMLSEFYDAVKRLRDMYLSGAIRIEHGFHTHSVYGYRSLIFESSQGLMLDPGIGVFPHVTRIPLGTPGMLDMCPDPHVMVVTRAYVTRHGNGPMPNEDVDHKIRLDEDETNVSNKWQGDFRRGILDLSVLQYAVNKDEYIRKAKSKTLVITCLDHLDGNYVFTYNGEVFKCDSEIDFVDRIAKRLGIRHVRLSHGPTAKDITRFSEF